jgi:hypothetical protein
MPKMAPMPRPKASPFVCTTRSRPKVKYGAMFHDGSHICTEIQRPITIPTTPQKIDETMKPFTV